jgi:flagellar biosynthetic protein FliR
MDISYHIDDVIGFILVLVRISTVVFVFPPFGASFFPRKWKISFSVILALVSYMIVRPSIQSGSDITTVYLVLLSLREVFLGLLIGLASSLIFYAVMLCSRVVSTQMGIAIANVYDPQSRTDISIVAQFHLLLALVLFFAVSGHHLIISGVIDIFKFFPVGELSFPIGSVKELVVLSSKVFSVAVQLGSSVVVILLLTSLSLGLIARTTPQINIFIVAFPLRLLVGLLALGLSIPYMARAMSDLFQNIPDDLSRVIGAV